MTRAPCRFEQSVAASLCCLALAIATVLLGIPASRALAQDQPRASASTNDQPRDVDEIVVTRKRLDGLRKGVEVAQESLYKVFNAHNSDHELDIHCALEPVLGSHLSRRVCRPNFVDTATSRAGKDYMWYIQGQCPDPPDPACIAAAMEVGTSVAQQAMGNLIYMGRRLDGEMQRLIRENPEVAKASAEYEAKKQAYKEAVDSRRK
jgi:hypothetical protein